ncbi:MAG: acetylglutamate kinase [Desulfobacterales bacterium]
MKSRILIKIGGRAFDGENGLKELAQAITLNPEAEVIIVHGGGAEISEALKAAGRETLFVDGMRVTQAEDIQIVESVLSGVINERIANWLGKHGVCCRRMSGKTQGLFIATPLLTRGGKSMGYVGKIVRVDPAIALDALAKKEVPVVSPISGDLHGQSYNVNADSAAAALAAAAHCTDLVFITDVPGVMVDGKMLPRLTVVEAKGLIADKTISGGMVAKMESVFEALDGKVPGVHVIQWQGPDTLRSIVTHKQIPGTSVRHV